jgi:DeoR/GlpR family transcriptional regulator of sugar metabolism
MFQEQRILRLKNYLQEHQQVDVVTLEEDLSISVSTLRRDLKKLETEGFLSRYHGGVITNTKATNPLYYLYDDPILS